MPRGRNYLTTDEIIAHLKHSFLPNLVVEGADDVVALRYAEELFQHSSLSLLPAGSRSAVLDVFHRRSELKPSSKVAFIVDKDLWILQGVPENLVDPTLIFSDGYSIANDIYRDGSLDGLMLPGERTVFREEIDRIVRWYAITVSRIFDQKPAVLKFHPNQLIDENLIDALSTLDQGEDFPEQIYEQIRADYSRMLRGKTLMQTLMRQLGRNGRVPQHHHLALFEQVGRRPGPLLENIYARVASVIGA